jgi:hypothetical protein
VIIEAPPTTDSPDAQTLASGAELAVLVVEAGPTNAREVVDACAQLESMGTPVLGAVIGRYGRDSDPDRRTGEPAVVAATEEPGTDTTDATDEATPAAEVPESAPAVDGAVDGAPISGPVNGDATRRTSAAEVPLPAISTPVTPAPTGPPSNGNGVAPAGTPPHMVPPGFRGPAPR